MYNYKILLKISGSIAAYKSAYLVSKLIQNGFEVQCVVTPSALNFIGAATLEGLSGRPVLLDSFEKGNMMSHISLTKWADLTILAPASGNTINKLASGIADNLVTSLFLAHDRKKPYLVAPAMNTAMMVHPATQDSLRKLKSWGVIVLETESGRLACGDEGYGKLIDPDKLYEIIKQTLIRIEQPVPGRKKILITSGGTAEKIDGVREIANISTGHTGARIADYFISQDWVVTYVHATDAILPENPCEKIPFTNFASLDTILQDLLKEQEYDSVIHLAAVSDYSVDSVLIGREEIKTPVNGKIDSLPEELIIRLRKNFKIINRIKACSKKRNPVLIAFKFTYNVTESLVRGKIEQLIHNSGADAVVWNDATSRTYGRQRNFTLFDGNSTEGEFFIDPGILAIKLEKIILKKITN